jgi:hypothetical protein
MRPYGSDRVRADGDAFLLACRVAKGWNARDGRHPGTAVCWDETYFEVADVTPLPNGAVEYRLEPWRDEHAMRHVDRYDRASEQQRIAEHRRNLERAAKAKSASLLGIFTGQRPAAVQEHLGNEYGISPPRLTLISTIPAWLAFGACVLLAADAKVRQVSSPIPIWLWVVAGLLFFESLIRFQVVFSQNRPMGSVLGFLGYSLYYFLAPNRAKLIPPLQAEKGMSATLHLSDEHHREAAFAVREPWLTLLSAHEQARLAQLYGYDYRRHAKQIALVILAIAAVGAFSMFGKNNLSALLAAALAVEQLVRLSVFPRRAIGSVLGLLVRPFTRKLFA